MLMGAPKFRAGDVPLAADMDDLAAELARANNLRVGSTAGLVGRSLASGPAIQDASARAVWGVLSGSSSPYTFTQILDGSFGPRAGTAYEVNGIAGLGGKTARLYPDRRGAWRFQWVAFPGGTGSCGTCSGVPSTLSGTWIYNSVTYTFPLVYATSASPNCSVPGAGWYSPCITITSAGACHFSNACSMRMVFYCAGASFNVGYIFYYAGGATSPGSGPSPCSTTTGAFACSTAWSSLSFTCSPLFWHGEGGIFIGKITVTL
jgi:hypothetical protein